MAEFRTERKEEYDIQLKLQEAFREADMKLSRLESPLVIGVMHLTLAKSHLIFKNSGPQFYISPDVYLLLNVGHLTAQHRGMSIGTMRHYRGTAKALRL